METNGDTVTTFEFSKSGFLAPTDVRQITEFERSIEKSDTYASGVHDFYRNCSNTFLFILNTAYCWIIIMKSFQTTHFKANYYKYYLKIPTIYSVSKASQNHLTDFFKRSFSIPECSQFVLYCIILHTFFMLYHTVFTGDILRRFFKNRKFRCFDWNRQM